MAPIRNQDSQYGSTERQQEPESPYHLQENRGSSSDESSSSVDSEYEMSLTELLYSSSSYHAIVKPVTLTMTLSALSVIFVNNEETIQNGEEELAAAYQVFDTENATGSEKLTLSLLNTLIMVCVIACMTFVIVFLYKFRFMKVLIGYMMFSSACLLGVLGGNLWYTAIEIYRWAVDKFTFTMAVYNFCIVGVISIFWAKGVPTFVTQGYLVATSVILAWQLAHFDAWTAWCLLFMLAVYDLCAVLTPCGPLKALVNLMQHEDAPEMPGLLYEAELPPEAQRPGVPRNRSDVANSNPSDIGNSDDEINDPVVDDRSVLSPNQPGPDENSVRIDPPTIEVPLAIAHVYNLEVISSKAMELPPPENPTVKQLKATVVVKLPAEGGRLERIPNTRRVAFLERDRFGVPKRTVWVDKQGKVFAEVVDGDDEDSSNRGNTIRLGLGDFIFYSILVAKAAQYSFATFAACLLVILAGLGGTLVLLSVYHHALPALPISIGLGIIAYLVTRLSIEPWIEAVMRTPYYV
jgi:presenilin 1